ncbi:MAG: InlB B-repeat-containing protein [Oscillospiraceae bacterium]|nr:InlB B-repeat-containing protein [Oscillospiraceae bacterium]
MSTSKKRNLKRRIVGCFCIAAIAANMAAPVIPVISDMGVITAAATAAYTVTFNTNGGEAIDGQQVVSGQTVNLPTPTRKNCTFGGWYTDEDLTIAFNPDSVVTSDLQLYAKWIVNIDLNALLAKAGTSSRYDSTGVTVEYFDNIYRIQLKESFYKISGSNLVNDAYVDVQIVTNYWVPNTYIDFDNASIINSGYYFGSTSLMSFSPFVTFGNTLTISGKLNIDTLSIYDGEGNYNITNLDEGYGNLVIDSFTVKFVDEDGVTVDENYYLKGYDYDVTTTGYIDKEMNEYSISEEFPCMKLPETVSDNTTVKVSKTHSDPDNNGNCTACEKHVEKVTFVTNGGSDIDPVVVLTGKTVKKPADPTKEKSYFGGWYTDEECTSPYDFTAPVDKDITLYAKWTAWAVDPIAVKTAPTKTNYIEGEEFDPTGLVITVTYDSGKTEDIAYGTENAADFKFAPSGALSESDTSVTITYDGKSTEQKIAVIVIANISSFEVTSSGVVVKYTVTGSTAVKSQTLKFSEVTEEMVELMKSKDIQLVIDFVNYSTAGSDTIILTAAQMKAIEYVLEHDFGM